MELDKVLTALSTCVNGSCEGCPYRKEDNCFSELSKQALLHMRSIMADNKRCRDALQACTWSKTDKPTIYTGESTDAFRGICVEMSALYDRKNKDYGDAFHKSWLEEGSAMARIRLGDKLNRFKHLTKDCVNPTYESIRDTLIDLANYSVMTILEYDRGDKNAECSE